MKWCSTFQPPSVSWQNISQFSNIVLIMAQLRFYRQNNFGLVLIHIDTLTGRRDDGEREGTLKEINIHASKKFIMHDLIPQKCEKEHY